MMSTLRAASPGSVSSISYVKNGISGMLEDVPKEKLINAVPFYTRLWIEAGDGSITSKAMGIADAKKWVDNNQVELTWPGGDRQYYGEKQTRRCLVASGWRRSGP